MRKEDMKLLDKMLKDRDPKMDAYEKVPIWKEKYNYELLDFGYVHTLEEFKKMNRGSIMKVISNKDEKLKKGGFIIDVKKNKNNKWFALVGIPSRGYIWKIYYDNNYIFVKESYSLFKNDETTDTFRNTISKFINKDEIDLDKDRNLTVATLHAKYVLSKK